MTNDARNTRHRQQKTTDQTTRLQHSIIDHLLRFLPPSSITLLESPPLLSHDIYPYNNSSYVLTHQRQLHYAPTLIGEDHLWRDGLHVAKRHRPLLMKSVAAAACGVNPHRHYHLARTPYGIYGPWEAPFGSGMGPPLRPPHSSVPPRNYQEFPPLNATKNYLSVAIAPPFAFRKSGHCPTTGIQPLTNRNIRRT